MAKAAYDWLDGWSIVGSSYIGGKYGDTFFFTRLSRQDGEEEEEEETDAARWNCSTPSDPGQEGGRRADRPTVGRVDRQKAGRQKGAKKDSDTYVLPLTHSFTSEHGPLALTHSLTHLLAALFF